MVEMIKIEIRTPMPQNCALGTVKQFVDTILIEVEGILLLKSGVKGLLKLKAENVNEIIERLPEFCASVRISKNSMSLLLKEHPCLVVKPILERGGIITRIEVEKDAMVWEIVCEESEFLKIMETLESLGVVFEVLYKGKLEKKDSITFREEEVARIALERGYFDFPRKIKLEELAQELGIAPSTLSEILRRAQKKILEKYFEIAEFRRKNPR